MPDDGRGRAPRKPAPPAIAARVDIADSADAECAREKMRARDLNPEDSHAYSAAKSAWIVAAEAEAMAEWHAGARP